MRSVAAGFSVSGDKVLTLNPKILDDGSVLFLHCALETMVESLHQKASSSLSGTSSSSMFVKLQPLPNGVFPYMEKDTSGKDAVCEALCHQEVSLPLRTEAATGGSRASDVAKFHCRVCEAGYDGQPGSSRVLVPQPQMRAHIATHILRGHIRMGPAGICRYCITVARRTIHAWSL